MLQSKNNNDQNMHIGFYSLSGELSIYHAGLIITHTHTHTYLKDTIN